jgi:hypothetical protein
MSSEISQTEKDNSLSYVKSGSEKHNDMCAKWGDTLRRSQEERERQKERMVGLNNIKVLHTHL